MIPKKSPGGSDFPYYFKNGELFGLKLGSYFGDEAGVIAMMKGEETFLMQQNRKIGVWIDFYETKLTAGVLDGFMQMLQHIRPRLSKLGIVGCSSSDRRKLNTLIKKAGSFALLPVRYFADPEEAKSWLVSEGG